MEKDLASVISLRCGHFQYVTEQVEKRRREGNFRYMGTPRNPRVIRRNETTNARPRGEEKLSSNKTRSRNKRNDGDRNYFHFLYVSLKKPKEWHDCGMRDVGS